MLPLSPTLNMNYHRNKIFAHCDTFIFLMLFVAGTFYVLPGFSNVSFAENLVVMYYTTHEETWNQSPIQEGL